MNKKIISIIAFPLFVCAAAYAQGITWTPANPGGNRGVLVMGGLGPDDNTTTTSADIFRTR